MSIKYFEPNRIRDCLVTYPENAEGPFSILYLLHGQFDTEQDWWQTKGSLKQILSETNLKAVIVMPFCANEKNVNGKEQTEPTLDSFIADFKKIDSYVTNNYKIASDKKAILGISMGGKQALAIVLEGEIKFGALGVLSGKFQGSNYTEIRNKYTVSRNFINSISLYYHYCGKAEEYFYDNNKKICEELGGKLNENPNGKHNWNFWNPEIEKFIKALSELWV